MVLPSIMALLAAQAAPAAVDAEIAPDLRCVAVLTMVGSQAPESQRAGLLGGTMYFVGRIDARRPHYDYKAGLAALLTDEAELKALRNEAARCGNEMKARGQALQEAGAALKAMEPAEKR